MTRYGMSLADDKTQIGSNSRRVVMVDMVVALGFWMLMRQLL